MASVLLGISAALHVEFADLELVVCQEAKGQKVCSGVKL